MSLSAGERPAGPGVRPAGTGIFTHPTDRRKAAPPPPSSPPAAASSTGFPAEATGTLNNALHIAAFCQLRRPGGEGRAYFERRVAEGKTKKEAVRALKRQLSNVVYRHLVSDATR